MKKSLPSVSFVTCTFNSQKTLKECLDSIKKLNYPESLIEVIIMDGGSKDQTIDIAGKYKFCKIIVKKTDGPESATAIGYTMAKNDYIVNFPSDNVILDKEWLRKMTKPLEENKDIVASETLHYSYVKRDKILNKYFALFGVNDPVAFYLNKRDRASHMEKEWHLKTPYERKSNYYIVKFNTDNLPTLGANGFVIRKKFARLVSKDPQKFFHIDSCFDLVKMGYNKFAFVKEDIWHKTGEEFFNFIKKRRRYATTLYFNKRKVRRYHLYNPETDKFKLFLFVFYSLTFVEPLFQSIRGYLKVKDSAWFLHPFICFFTTIIYSHTVLLAKLNQNES